MRYKVFVEGGGDNATDQRCRHAFASFVKRLSIPRGQPAFVPCGSRSGAYKRFCNHLRLSSGEPALLLVDAEEAVAPGRTPWEHAQQRAGDNWSRPSSATDDHLHFMAVCMESWLIADADSLAKHFGDGFRATALPKAADLESVEKPAILDALKRASKDTSKPYAKGKIAFAALAATDIRVVAERMSYCRRFVAALTSEPA